MATYATDLTDLNTAESVTGWAELTNYASGGSNVLDGENFIQGSDCISQTTGQKSGAVFSIAYDNGSAITWTTGEVFLVWQYYAIGANLASYANGGMRVGVFSSLTAGDIFYTGGSDRAPYPAGAWQNIAIDPENTTHETTDGGGNGGSYRYISSMLNTLVKVTKGNPHACDCIRYGRGEIYCTGTGANFTGMAQENDYNDNTNGYHRWGLLSDTGGGTFLWKGLMSLGQSGTSTTFSDSNKTIVIDDAAKTYLDFNKIEINNASSDISWTNISFAPLGTTSPGQLEVIDNATVAMTGCIFNNMDTFGFLSNSDIESCTFNTCKQITTGGANMLGSNILESSVAADTGAIYQNVAYTDTYLDSMTFSKGTNAHHAIDFGTAVTSNLTLRNIEFTDFGSTDDSNDSTVRFLATSGSLTLSLIGCTVNGSVASTSNFSIDDAAGITVTLSIDPVDINITVLDVEKNAIENAQVGVFLLDSPFTELMNEDSAAGTGLATESYGGSLPVDIKWRVRKSDTLDDPRYKAQSGTGEITSNGFNLTVTLIEQPLPI